MAFLAVKSPLSPLHPPPCRYRCALAATSKFSNCLPLRSSLEQRRNLRREGCSSNPLPFSVINNSIRFLSKLVLSFFSGTEAKALLFWSLANARGWGGIDLLISESLFLPIRIRNRFWEGRILQACPRREAPKRSFELLRVCVWMKENT